MVVLLDRVGKVEAVEPSILYVPETAMPNEGEPVLVGKGTRTLEGTFISTRTWRFTNRTNGRTQTCCVVDDEMSDDAIAQAKGEAKDNFLRDTNGLPRLVPPSRQQRLDVGGVLRDIRARRKRRAESSSGKINF